MERRVREIINALLPGKRAWLERGVYVYRERKTGRVRFGISYQARCSNGARKRRRELVEADSLASARKALHAVQVDTSRGTRVIAAAPLPTFDQYAEEYVRGRENEIASLSRSRGTFTAASAVFGGVRIDLVQPHHVAEFKRQRLMTCEPGTVLRDLVVLKHCFKLAVKVYRYRSDNPAEDVKIAKYQEKPRRALSIEEEDRLVAAAPPYLKPFIRTATNTGLRRSELTRLQWSDVDFSTNRITVRESKSRKVQIVPMNRIVREVLLELRGAGKIGPVFTFEGRRFDDPKKGIGAAARRAGIGKVTCHVFRHTAATRMVDAGVDLRVVQAIMRHASITTTMRYVHGGNLEAGAEKLADYVERGK
jgi:integrase